LLPTVSQLNTSAAGVPLSHGNLAASLDNIVRTYELLSRDRSLLVMPLFHVHGLMAGEYRWVAGVSKLGMWTSVIKPSMAIKQGMLSCKHKAKVMY
jgi:acyl-CoA synthetase (AMP-forming)/AMP-acid ligase II